MAEKENLSQNSNDFIPSSQDSPATTTTQRLHLELDDEESLKMAQATETQFLENEVQVDESPTRPDKRPFSESESEKGPRKSIKLDDSVMVEAENSGFSDVEVLNNQEKTNESIEVVTLGDSLSESPATFSGESKSVKEEIFSEASEAQQKIDEEPSEAHQKPDEETQSQDQVTTDTAEDNNSIENVPTDDKATNDESDSIGQASATIETPNAPKPTSKDSLLLDDGGAKESPRFSQPMSSSTPDKPSGNSLANSASLEYRENETLKLPESSPEEEFKSPSDSGNESGMTIVRMKTSEFKKMQKNNEYKVEEHVFVPESMTLRNVLDSKNRKGLLRRLSDLSGLSGSSSGYNADASSSGGQSSIGGSSTSSKRDRLSIMPEAVIEPHKVLSPLPKRFAPKAKPETKPAPKVKVEMKVFAKWVERTETRYWPGVIKEEREDQLSILFDDGFEKEMKREDILPADGLLPGCEVNVEKEEGIHQKGVILSHPDCSEAGNVFYNIQLEGSAPLLPETEAEAFSYKKLHLSSKQFEDIQSERGVSTPRKRQNVSSAADVSLDNLQTGKRKSKSRTPVRPPAPPKRRGKRGGEAVDTSVHETESEVEATKENAPQSTTTDDDQASAIASEKKRRGRPTKKNVALFKNLVFVLTQGKSNDERDTDRGESAMDTETEDDEDILEEPKFDRKSLKLKILGNGGKILRSFPGDNEKIPENLIIISDRVCRTMTYLMSIAYGFERIHFTWILNCVSEKKLLTRQNYMLQVGFSKTLNRDIEHLDAKTDRRSLMKDLHILIASTKQAFGDDWKPVLTRIGASVSVRSKGKLDRSLKAVDLIIGDEAPPSSIVKDAQDKNMFIVGTEWIVQCLINGRRLPYGDYVI